MLMNPDSIWKGAIILGASAVIASCTGGPAVEGLFNNEKNYQSAIQEHEAAWLQQIGPVSNRRNIEATVRRHGGECLKENDDILCVVDTKPKWPSIFTTRHFWHVKLTAAGEGRFKLKSSHVYILGMDV